MRNEFPWFREENKLANMQLCLEGVQNCRLVDSCGVKGIDCVSALALRFHVVLAAKGEALPGPSGHRPASLCPHFCPL